MLEEIISSSKNDDLVFTLKLLSCLLDKLAALSKNSATFLSDDMCRVIIYILNNFSKGITLADAAAVAGLTSVYFSSVFKENMGISFKKYSNDLQFDYSAKLLKFSDMSVAQICSESGFTDYANFSIRFKTRFSLTPKEYRQLNKKI